MKNDNLLKGKWLEIKGDLQKTWGKLTNDDLEKTRGDVKSIAGLLQQRYGEAQDTYIEKVTEIIRRFDLKKERVVTNIKEALKN